MSNDRTVIKDMLLCNVIPLPDDAQRLLAQGSEEAMHEMPVWTVTGQWLTISVSATRVIGKALTMDQAQALARQINNKAAQMALGLLDKEEPEPCEETDGPETGD